MNLELALQSSENLTVETYLSENYFPYYKEDGEIYEVAHKIEVDTCKELGGEPSEIMIVTSDNCDNYEEFDKLFSILNDLPTIKKISYDEPVDDFMIDSNYSIVEYNGIRYATAYDGVSIIYYNYKTI